MELAHLEDILHDSIALDELVRHIDSKFTEFDLDSTEVASHIVTTYGNDGLIAINQMLEKKQVFIGMCMRLRINFNTSKAEYTIHTIKY